MGLRTRGPRISSGLLKSCFFRIPVKTACSLSKSYAKRPLGSSIPPGQPPFLSPWQHEKKLLCILKAVDLMLRRCEETVRHTSRPLLCWLRSVDRDRHSMKPFRLVAREVSASKHRRHWKRFITFVFRSHLATTTVREKSGIILKPTTIRLIRQIWKHRAWNCVESGEELWQSDLEHETRSEEDDADTDTERSERDCESGNDTDKDSDVDKPYSVRDLTSSEVINENQGKKSS